MTRSIQFGSKIISFQLEFSDRKTLGITISPDLSVLVKAPIGTSIEKIEKRLIKKAPWIIKQQNLFSIFHPKTPERRFINGESHLYLGRQYRLQIVLGKKSSVKLKGGFIEVTALDKSDAKELINEWYLKNARIKLIAFAQPLVEKFIKYNVEPKSIVLRHMPTRWGSCTSDSKIILNPELIKAPKACIEYVITHELCHLVHHDHTQKFIDLQNKEMPDWERWKMKLEKLLA